MDKQLLKQIIREEVQNALNEAKLPSNIETFAKSKKILPLVMQVARWAEKAGKKIVGGTAVGKNYDTLVLDVTREGSEIRIDIPGKKIEVNDKQVDNYKEFVAALSLNEATATIDSGLLNKLKMAMKIRMADPEDEGAHDEVQMVLTQIYKKAGLKGAEELAAGNMEDEVTMTGPVSAVVSLIKDTMEDEMGSGMSGGSSSKAAVMIFPSWMTGIKYSHIAIDKTATGSIIRDNMGRPAHWSYSYPGSPMEVLQVLMKANAVVKKGSEWFEPDDGLIDSVLESNTKFKEIN